MATHTRMEKKKKWNQRETASCRRIDRVPLPPFRLCTRHGYSRDRSSLLPFIRSWYEVKRKLGSLTTYFKQQTTELHVTYIASTTDADGKLQLYGAARNVICVQFLNSAVFCDQRWFFAFTFGWIGRDRVFMKTLLFWHSFARPYFPYILDFQKVIFWVQSEATAKRVERSCPTHIFFPFPPLRTQTPKRSPRLYLSFFSPATSHFFQLNFGKQPTLSP